MGGMVKLQKEGSLQKRGSYIHSLALLVNDYDEAINYYTHTLGFRLVEDTPLSPLKRWVLVAPPAEGGACLLLARAATEEQRRLVGNQSGGQVFLFLHTADFWAEYTRLREKGVQFTEEPRSEPYGTVAVFTDLYGNKWDLVEPSKG